MLMVQEKLLICLLICLLIYWACLSSEGTLFRGVECAVADPQAVIIQFGLALGRRQALDEFVSFSRRSGCLIMKCHLDEVNSCHEILI